MAVNDDNGQAPADQAGQVPAGQAGQPQAGQQPASGSATKGNIFINSKPSGANIQLDCKDTQKQTPITLTDIEPGDHTVWVSLKGCTTTTKTVQVTAGSTTNVCLTIMTKENKRDIYYIVGWTCLFLSVTVGLALLDRFNLLGITDPLTKILIWVTCAGGLGGVIFNFYELSCHLGVGDFDFDYFWWYILRPFIGMGYGLMIFFFVAGGLMTLSGTTSSVLPDTLFTRKAIMFYIALSFLVGYAEEPVSLELKALAESLFKKPPRPDSQGTQTKKD